MASREGWRAVDVQRLRPRPRPPGAAHAQGGQRRPLRVPHAAQVLQITRKRRDLHASARRFKTVTVYTVTSLPFELARPARLADLLRRHWAIEAHHNVRGVIFAEGACKVRTGTGPHVMATLRNLVIGVLSGAGPVN